MASITISWPSRVLSPNVTASHWRKGPARKAAKTEAFYLAKQAGLKAPVGQVKVFIDAYPKHERRRDHDNLLASLKGHLDGLAAALGVDDSLFRPVLTIHPADGRGVIDIAIGAA